MKKLSAILLLLFPVLFLLSQSSINSLKKQLATAKDDSTRLILLNGLFYEYLYSYSDSSLPYVQQEILLAKKTQSNLALAKAYIDYSAFFGIIGDYPEELRFNLEALKLGEKSKDWFIIARVYHDIAEINSDQGDYKNSIFYSMKAKSLMEQHWAPSFKEDLFAQGDCTGDTVANYLFTLSGLEDTYEKSGHLDSALIYLQICNDAVIKLTGKMDDASVLHKFGNIYLKKGDYATALKYYHTGVSLATTNDITLDVMKNCMGIADTYKKTGEFDSSIFYANKVVELSKWGYNLLIKLDALNLLADIYKSRHNTDSVAKYFELIMVTKDSLFSQKKMIQLQSITFDEQRRQQELSQQQQQLQNKIKIYSLLAGLIVFLLIAFLLYRNNHQKKKANALLTQQKEKVENTLAQVSALQAHLVETEEINERLRISRELHDDIGGTLSGIVLYSHLAENQNQAQHADEVEQSLNIIQQSANDMVNKLSDIVWSVNPEHNSLKNLVQKLEEYAGEMARVKNIKVQVNKSECLAEFQLPVETCHNIYLLCKEAINNAVKYSHASFLELGAHHADHFIEFTITDNGEGFDISTIKKGNGLMNMQKRADEINARLCVRSTPHQGTVISFQWLKETL
jgi:signal transduction histidine kinase